MERLYGASEPRALEELVTRILAVLTATPTPTPLLASSTAAIPYIHSYRTEYTIPYQLTIRSHQSSSEKATNTTTQSANSNSCNSTTTSRRAGAAAAQQTAREDYTNLNIAQ